MPPDGNSSTRFSFFREPHTITNVVIPPVLSASGLIGREFPKRLYPWNYRHFSGVSLKTAFTVRIPAGGQTWQIRKQLAD